MTIYTVTAFKKVEKDLARLSHVFNAVAPFLTLVYLCYALIVGSGNTVINAIGAALSFVYFAYYLIFLFRLERINKRLKSDKTQIKEIKKEQRNTKRVYKISKILVGLVSLAISIYTIYLTLNNVTPLSVLLVGLSAIAWVLNLIIFLAYEFFSSKVEFIIDGIEYDLERINPVKNVKDIINRAQGKEIEIDTEKISLKNRALLDKLAQKEREEKEQNGGGQSKVKNFIKNVFSHDANDTENE